MFIFNEQLNLMSILVLFLRLEDNISLNGLKSWSNLEKCAPGIRTGRSRRAFFRLHFYNSTL